MNDLIRLTFRKYDGSLHWHSSLRRLGEDEHGLWLGWGRNHRIARGAEPPITIREPYVQLIRWKEWWCGSFNAAPRDTEIYCDITTVAEWTAPDEISLIDLDLDVLRFRDGRLPLIDDEDEFLEHQVRYGYPPEVIATARATADRLLEAVRADEEPFKSGYHRWLAMVEDVDGDPFAELDVPR
jgi:protein associated with RNAse G/E